MEGDIDEIFEALATAAEAEEPETMEHESRPNK